MLNLLTQQKHMSIFSMSSSMQRRAPPGHHHHRTISVTIEIWAAKLVLGSLSKKTNSNHPKMALIRVHIYDSLHSGKPLHYSLLRKINEHNHKSPFSMGKLPISTGPHFQVHQLPVLLGSGQSSGATTCRELWESGCQCWNLLHMQDQLHLRYTRHGHH